MVHQVLNLYVVFVSVILFVGTLVVGESLRLASLVLLCFIFIESIRHRRRLERDRVPFRSRALPNVARQASVQPPPFQGASDGAKEGAQAGGDYRSTPSYRKLLTACGGDRRTVERLIDYEIKKDLRLSRSAATVSALDRLYVDRRHFT